MRRNQRHHAVSGKPQPGGAVCKRASMSVHPMGQPIRASTNSGFKTRVALEVFPPAFKIVRAGREWMLLAALAGRAAAGQFLDWWVRSQALRLPALGLVPSQAFGVAHRLAAVWMFSPPSRPALLAPVEQLAVGVGHILAA